MLLGIPVDQFYQTQLLLSALLVSTELLTLSSLPELLVLTVVVKVDASDTVMINHVLHDYAERVSNAARHHSMRLCWHTTSWVHNAVMYV